MTYLQTLRDLVLAEADDRDNLEESKFLAIEVIKTLDYDTLQSWRLAHSLGEYSPHPTPATPADPDQQG